MTSEPPLEPVHRHVAVVPVVVAVLALLVLSVVVTVVITLATATTAGNTSQQPDPSTTPSVNAGDGESPLEASPIAPTRESTGARCVDFTEETKSLDLDEVLISQADKGELSVQFTVASALPSGASRLGIVAERADAERAYEFSVELVDGEIDSVTSIELDGDKREKLDLDEAEVDGTAVRFTVTRSIGKKLGDDWSWFAFSEVDGSTVDVCPGAPGSRESLTFERDSESSDSSDRDD
ncbi:hypothetical protein [Salinibacterium sp. M195]|uniref:hypothetical protein n=1 Tax=Salinibacterium sp. M195 TaxID=2583374 RepID=UPI001C627461|nr:hypothetical protein [Salinibacterium sp. M195]QYH36486.1 hypothetical protein FFT87_11300 [Salinibacterium sp. M195]